jgi:nucleoid-associated protein YgaU
MAGRYKTNKIKKLNDGREVYKSKIIPNIPKSDNDIYVAVQTGDRLDSIAKEHLGDASLWWIIADANNIHDAPFSLADGTVLRIPSNPQGVINAVNKV